MMENIWIVELSLTGNIHVFLKELKFLLNTEIYLGDLIAVDMEIGPLGVYVTSCQFLIHFNNLSPFEV